MNGNRWWQIGVAAIALLVGMVGWFLAREFNHINARLDRITDYVLEHQQQPK